MKELRRVIFGRPPARCEVRPEKDSVPTVDLDYWLVLVADEVVAAGKGADGTGAGSTITVRVEVLVRPWLSVTT
jgi:hypothetical protein